MIDVAFTRTEMRPADIAVVIDVLRATSTITQALASGYRSVVCVSSVQAAARLRAPGRVIAGEQRCITPAGFDQGNSPGEAMSPRGDELVLATTNGAPTIVAVSSRAEQVMLASLLNLKAVLEVLSPSAGLEVQIICAGTDGAPALEDTYLAGRICAALPGDRTDAALIAEAVARGFGTPFEALAASADARVLRAAGLANDIAHCALESCLHIVPRVLSASEEIATVGLPSTQNVAVRRAPREAVAGPRLAQTR
ncbi:MAG TPA: 2-phosphosulfolactate phosphatase [Solirubrobacteraceae bacterium]